MSVPPILKTPFSLRCTRICLTYFVQNSASRRLPRCLHNQLKVSQLYRLTAVNFGEERLTAKKLG
jgi:hypothetical protein